MLRLSIFLPLVVLVTACNHYYYAPNTMHQPLLRERHDASVRGGIGLGSEYLGVEAQTAYSPLKHVAVQYNYFSIVSRRSDAVFGSPREIRGHLHEGGIGTYWDLSYGAQFNLYGGYGTGRVFNRYAQEGVTSELQFERWFAQPGIIIYDDKLRFNLGVRFSHLAYTKGFYDLRLEGSERENILAIQEQSPYLLVETGLGFSLHLRPAVISLNFVNSQSRKREFAHKRGYSNLALALDLHDLYRKRAKKKG